jgi:hypothetical protein
MYKGTRRYGLQSNVFSTNPWALMKTAVKSECPTHAQAEALACLDQAQQFFGAAVRADLVAAKPLLLYYAFMNIAKALCLTRSRRATFDQAQHGLSEKLGPGGVELIDAYLKAYPSSPSSPVANVFADFVGTLGGASIAPTYDVVNLMPQIVAGHRLWCDATGNRERFVAIERINIMERSSTKSIWLRVYVYAGDLTRLSVTRRLLLDESRLAGAWLEVSPLEENRRTLLRFEQVSTHQYTHRASDEIPDLVSAFRGLLWATVNSAPPFRRYYLYLCPVAEHTQVLPQLAAIYAVMFYLGSIARYRPQQMQAILDGEYGEHVQEILASQPNQFLYLVASEFVRREVTRAAIV